MREREDFVKKPFHRYTPPASTTFSCVISYHTEPNMPVFRPAPLAFKDLMTRGCAIRIAYRISLRSSSIWEPRYPSLNIFGIFFKVLLLVNKIFRFVVVDFSFLFFSLTLSLTLHKGCDAEHKREREIEIEKKRKNKNKVNVCFFRIVCQ
ncbi:MAG: hypothetical protein KGZ37_10720 [Nitrosarchaeum sp.]|nr:hypothetical protein [Nitrosarchaeum sp.]